MELVFVSTSKSVGGRQETWPEEARQTGRSRTCLKDGWNLRVYRRRFPRANMFWDLLRESGYGR